MWTRDFGLFFAARTISMLGSSMMPVAIALGMHEAGYGATGVGLALASWMLPMAGLILFGGVITDRFTPRRMMVAADVIRAVVQTLTAVLFLTGRPVLWQILVLTAITGAAAAMYTPGVAGTIPRITTDVQRANATLRVSEAIMQLAGPGLAGLLVGFIGVGMLYAADAVGFAASAACLLLMRARVAATAQEPMMVRLREGWREFRSRTWMWSVILIWVIFGITLFGPLIPLGSTLVTGMYGQAAYGLVMSAGGAGTILGGLVAMRLRPARPLAAGAVAMFLFAAQPLTMSLEADLWVIMAGFVLGGAGWAFWSVMWATSVQTQVPQEALNRVSAYEIGGSTISIPIGQALAGPVAGLFGAAGVLSVSTVVALAGCVALLAVPQIRRLARVTA
ncbi:MFS transporter [Nonomuraea soli]|uniref:MFS family permease n=1 Tax=Nonomuraea soli TaxID=1032476 RepID=A0A7W0HPW4_9ACTN|nr:MFS transporter [Nonomuraea soli]MBA2891293.1 MFS family permease [Nonomuraea soli]